MLWPTKGYSRILAAPVLPRPQRLPFPLNGAARWVPDPSPDSPLFGLLVLPAAGLQAQDAEQSNLARAIDSFDFREIGPAVMGGRVSDLDVHPGNSSHWFVGFGTGGLWETRNEGMSWTPLFDEQPVSSIGDVTLAPSNPNVIWVGTGEPQNRNSSPYGGGVYRSVDGGRTWTNVGLNETPDDRSNRGAPA